MTGTRHFRALPRTIRTASFTRPRRLSVPDHLTCRQTAGCVLTPEHKGTCLPRPRTTSAAPVTR
jgi:hypothetical protein